MAKLDVRSFPMIALVGGRVRLPSGEFVDSRKPANELKARLAITKALTQSSDWWTTVVSIVIPTLNDDRGGFATVDARSIGLAKPGGGDQLSRLPAYPRLYGGDDYIYSRADHLKKLIRHQRRVQTALKQGVEPERSDVEADPHATVFILTRSQSLSAQFSNLPPPAVRLIVAPDTSHFRGHLQRGIPSAIPAEHELDFQDGSGVSACAISAFFAGGEWRDPTPAERARRFLLKRFDLKIGLWDLALNPTLRAAVMGEH